MFRSGSFATDEDWVVLRSFLPAGWKELGRSSGALKGLRKDKSAESVLRVLLLYLGCGHSLRETAVRARKAGLARFPVSEGDCILVDRGYATAAGFRRVSAAGALLCDAMYKVELRTRRSVVSFLAAVPPNCGRYGERRPERALAAPSQYLVRKATEALAAAA